MTVRSFLELRIKSLISLYAFLGLIVPCCCAIAAEPAKPVWRYTPELMRPIWSGKTMEAESVLFIKDPTTGEAKGSVLFPVEEVLVVRNSAGDTTYEIGRDYVWKRGSREIVLPAGSRIVSQPDGEGDH